MDISGKLLELVKTSQLDSGTIEAAVALPTHIIEISLAIAISVETSSLVAKSIEIVLEGNKEIVL